MRDDKANRKAKDRAERARSEIRDRRRFHVTSPADGRIKNVVSESMSGTIYPRTLQKPNAETDVLMDGAMNRKIGGDVMVGKLKGARILTLALEERKTCPQSCLHWTTCYGNNMGFVKRWRHGPDLEAAIRSQINRHFAQPSPSALLIRLHVLGDFYSMDYVKTWVNLIDLHPDLHLFGFTAHPTDSEIGAAIKRVRESAPDQFAIRTSGETGPMGSWTIDWPTEKRFIRINGDVGIVCPEQRDANDTGKREKHCGNCAACWQSNIPVVFIEH